mgnify:CR=1 FL=1
MSTKDIYKIVNYLKSNIDANHFSTHSKEHIMITVSRHPSRTSGSNSSFLEIEIVKANSRRIVCSSDVHQEWSDVYLHHYNMCNSGLLDKFHQHQYLPIYFVEPFSEHSLNCVVVHLGSAASSYCHTTFNISFPFFLIAACSLSKTVVVCII